MESLSKRWKRAVSKEGLNMSFADYAKIESKKHFNANGDSDIKPSQQNTEPVIQTMATTQPAAPANTSNALVQAIKEPFISGCVPNCILYGSIGLAVGIVAVLLIKKSN